MSKIGRREWMTQALSAMAAGSAAGLRAAAQPPLDADRDASIKLCLVWSIDQPHLIKLARQIGITHSIASTAGALGKVPRSQYGDTVAKIKARYEAAGMTIAAIESHPVPAEKIKLGLPGRDEEIENYIAAMEAIGAAGIRTVCYDFMAGIDWYRTRTDQPGRGGALSLAFDKKDSDNQGLTQWGRISEDTMWANIEYFQKAVIPSAEKAGVQMALHPDDPPIPELRGIARILTSARNYRRVMDMVPSPVNGVTFDHSIFYLMGEDIRALAKEWCQQKKIFYVHARNLTGTRGRFLETFQDNGAIDFGEMFQTYYDNGFRGPVRPDHDPMLDGESNDHPGYGTLGKIFAIGYIKGVMASRRIPFV